MNILEEWFGQQRIGQLKASKNEGRKPCEEGASRVIIMQDRLTQTYTGKVICQHILEATKIFTPFDPELLLLCVYFNEVMQSERKTICVSTFTTTVFSNIGKEASRTHNTEKLCQNILLNIRILLIKYYVATKRKVTH